MVHGIPLWNIASEGQKKMKTRPIFQKQSLLSSLVRTATSMRMKSRRKAFGKKASVWADVPWRPKQNIRYIEVHSLSRVWNGWEMYCFEYSNSRLATKKKPVLHKQYGCGGTSVRRHGKEDAQVTKRRRGLHCCYYEMWDWFPLFY